MRTAPPAPSFCRGEALIDQPCNWTVTKWTDTEIGVGDLLRNPGIICEHVEGMGHPGNTVTTTHLCRDGGEHLWVVLEPVNHWRQLVCMEVTWTMTQEGGAVIIGISGEHGGPMDIWKHGGHLWMSGVCGPPISVECMRHREYMRTSGGCLGYLGVYGLLGHM